jgi:hypothetical protein
MGNNHYSCISTCKMFPCLGQVRNVGGAVGGEGEIMRRASICMLMQFDVCLLEEYYLRCVNNS